MPDQCHEEQVEVEMMDDGVEHCALLGASCG
jgi:hypothetical protein